MSADELALKFSSAPAEALIGKLPVAEVREALADEVSDEVAEQLYMEHSFELECESQRADAANDLAVKYETVANEYGTAIKRALTLSPEAAQDVLKKALEDFPGYGRDAV